MGKASTSPIGPSSAEHAAQEYFINRKLAGNWAPKPPIERWRGDQRERFEAELRRLESLGPGDAA